MTDLAIIKKDIVDVVSTKVKSFQNAGELNLPVGYSPDNAMKSAFLVLQNTFDKNKQPVLNTCTPNSVANSLLDMCVQGLNPTKKQGYFIAYGKQLSFQRSYFGTIAVVKTLCGARDVHAQVVWGDDAFEYAIKRGNKIVETHKQKIEHVGKDPKAAYCIIEFENGREYTDIMTMDQIKKSWSKSKMNPNDDRSTHKQFEEQMIRKTIINRACNKYINSSSDKAVLVNSFNRASDISNNFEIEAANTEFIDIMPDEVVMKEGEACMSDAEKAEIISNEASEDGPIKNERAEILNNEPVNAPF